MDTTTEHTSSASVSEVKSSTVPATATSSASRIAALNSTADGAVVLGGDPLLTGSESEIYRSVSRAAVASVLMGLLGLISFGIVFLLAIPAVGLILALLGLRGIRRFPDEIQGKPMALGGVLLCGLTLVLAPSWHLYVYATEVPEGYERVPFSKLMSDKNEPDAPTMEALELDGDSIFIKGYIHPSSMSSMMAKRFVIVPDLGTCCFGGQPPLTNMVEVTLTGDQYAKKSLRRQRLAGTFRVDTTLKPVDELQGVYYQLKADILK